MMMNALFSADIWYENVGECTGGSWQQMHRKYIRQKR